MPDSLFSWSRWDCLHRWRHQVLFLACLLVMAPPSAAAQPRLNIGVIDVPPYGQPGQGNPQGLYPRFLAELSRDTGIQLDLTLMPFARAAHLLASGHIDGSIMFQNNVTDRKTIALAPLFVTAQVVQPRPGIALRGKTELAPLLIGRIRGGCQDLEADTSYRWRFYEVNTQQQGIDMLLAKRIDAFCSATEGLQNAAAKFDRRRELDATARFVVSQKEVWFLASGNVDAGLQQRLHDGIVRLQRNGTVARIFQEVLGPQYELTLPAGAR